MPPALVHPGQLDGHTLALLLLINFHCKVDLPESANEARRALLLFLMRSIYQDVAPSESLSQFLVSLRGALSCDPEQAEVACHYLVNTLRILDFPDGLTTIFNDKLGRIIQPYETVGLVSVSETYIERRSFFGLYFRRMKLVFDSLDLQGRVQLRERILSWKDPDLYPSLSMEGSMPLGEEEQNPRMEAYEKYKRSMFQGMYNQAKDSMQKLFDYFAPGSDRELHQHTLLNLAAFHYETGSLSAGKAALEEAISLARSASDAECIVACESLMRRIQGEGTSRPTEHIHNRETHPKALSNTDALWQTQHDIYQGAPLLQVLQRLHDSVSPQSSELGKQASSVQISLSLMYDAKRRIGKDAVRPDAVLAEVWSKAGQEDVANVFVERGSGNHLPRHTLSDATRLDATCHKASKLTMAGKYEEALALLLRPDTFGTLSFKEYQAWCEKVWDVLWKRAKRREERKTLELLAEVDPGSRHVAFGMDVEDLVQVPKALQEALLERQSDSKAGQAASQEPSEASFGRREQATAEEKVEALIEKARKLSKHNPALALSPALLAIALAKELDLARLEWASTITLAELSIEGFKMPRHGMAAIEDMLPQILADEDLERRGIAQWAYARAILACAGQDKQDDTIREALGWAERAEQDMEAVSLLGTQGRVLYYIARLCHHLGEVEKRDAASGKLALVESEWLRATEAECAESLTMVEEVLSMTNLVGGFVASGKSASAAMDGW